MFVLRRLPARRIELLIYFLVFSGFYSLVWVVQRQGLPSMSGASISGALAVAALELLLPLAVALLAAGALAGDPVLDILLTAHRPAWAVMVERLLIIGGLGATFGIAALLLAYAWDVPLPVEGSDQVFIWLSPMLFCMGLANAAALLRGRRIDGVLAVVGAMGGALVASSQMSMLCAGSNPCAWWLANPLMTLAASADTYWPVNRLLWLAAGAVLLAASLRLAKREEPLLQPAAEE